MNDPFHPLDGECHLRHIEVDSLLFEHPFSCDQWVNAFDIEDTTKIQNEHGQQVKIGYNSLLATAYLNHWSFMSPEEIYESSYCLNNRRFWLIADRMRILNDSTIFRRIEGLEFTYTYHVDGNELELKLNTKLHNDHYAQYFRLK